MINEWNRFNYHCYTGWAINKSNYRTISCYTYIIIIWKKSLVSTHGSWSLPILGYACSSKSPLPKITVVYYPSNHLVFSVIKPIIDCCELRLYVFSKQAHSYLFPTKVMVMTCSWKISNLWCCWNWQQFHCILAAQGVDHKWTVMSTIFVSYLYLFSTVLLSSCLLPLPPPDDWIWLCTAAANGI